MDPLWLLGNHALSSRNDWLSGPSKILRFIPSHKQVSTDNYSWLALGRHISFTDHLSAVAQPQRRWAWGLASSGSSMFSSARSAENTLNRISWTLLALFMGLAVVLSAGWLN